MRERSSLSTKTHTGGNVSLAQGMPDIAATEAL